MVDAGGRIRVAAVDHGQPSATVTLVVKAGTRHEPKPGVAHLLKNYAFKNTTDRSALRLAREAELFGGVLSASHGREHLALTAAFLKGDEAHFIDLLASVLTKTRYTPHEFAESVLPALRAESAEAAADGGAAALDLAHALAFRTGLGAPLVASHDAEHLLAPGDARAFAQAAFARENVAVVGTGIDVERLRTLVGHALDVLPSSPSPSPAPTQYFGGESRIARGHGAQTLFIGYGTTPAAGVDAHALAALTAHLAPHPRVKWATGGGEGARVEPVLLAYTDAALVGVLVHASAPPAARAAAASAVRALQRAAAGEVTPEEIKRAVGRAKFDAASALECREGAVGVAIAQLLKGKDTPLDTTFASLDKVNATALTKAASTLTKAKPVFVAVGDIHALPYADELGL